MFPDVDQKRQEYLNTRQETNPENPLIPLCAIPGIPDIDIGSPTSCMHYKVRSRTTMVKGCKQKHNELK
jgi:hypothetical protein